MPKPRLQVVAGGLPRDARSQKAALDGAIAKNARKEGPAVHESLPDSNGDVIPLLDGWVRRLERQSSPTDH